MKSTAKTLALGAALLCLLAGGMALPASAAVPLTGISVFCIQTQNLAAAGIPSLNLPYHTVYLSICLICHFTHILFSLYYVFFSVLFTLSSCTFP